MMFASEKELEAYLRELIKHHVTGKFPHVYVLETNRVADIVICRDGRHPAAFFLEAKFFKERNGRIGVGSGGGGGYQPEVIEKAPDYFERHLRWILVDGRKDTPSFVFVSTHTLRDYLAGAKIGRKFNNIQPRIFDEIPGLDETRLIRRLSNWLSP